MRHSVAQVDQRSQEPIDEDQLVLLSRSDSPPARPVEQRGISATVQDRPQLRTKSAITEVESPMIRRSDMIGLRAAIPTTNSPTTQPNHPHANPARAR